MTSHREENARTLASLLGIKADEATQLLNCSIVLRWVAADRGAAAIGRHLRALLVRTVSHVTVNENDDSSTIEIAIGAIQPERRPALRVAVRGGAIRLGRDVPPEAIPNEPEVLYLLAACYAAGMALKAALGDEAALPGPSPERGLVISLEPFVGSDPSWILVRTAIGRVHLAGAGAIGNAFLYALGLLDVQGEVVVVDHDVVSDGNLNRCIFFEADDVGRSKAVVLADRAATRAPLVRFRSEAMTLADLGRVNGGPDPSWLRRLVVAVDSPRVRRSLQTELPGEVFDASTTGVEECVFHHHRQPTKMACLACIYYESPDELAHERHVADTLGVSLKDVQQREVSSDAADRIRQRYPDFEVNQLVGQSYDSLFKALCGRQQLSLGQAEQVLAPFAFVSMLAGAYLALELVRRVAGAPSSFNYWRISPWNVPVEQLKSLRPRHLACDYCSIPSLVQAADKLWGSGDSGWPAV